MALWGAADMLKMTTPAGQSEAVVLVPHSFQLEGTGDWEVREPILPQASENCLELLNVMEAFSASFCH